MAAHRCEKVFACVIYLLMGVSTAQVFSVGLANGITSRYHYPIQQKLLIGAALTGAATLLISAVLIYFRPAKAYAMAMFALPLLLLAFWPYLEMAVHRPALFYSQSSLSDLLPMMLLPAVVVFTPLRLLKFVRS